MYGDPDHQENAITKMVQNLYQSNDETVRAYEQRWKTMWRETGWHKCPEQWRYDLIWEGLRPRIKSRIKHQATSPDGHFEDISELFTRAAAADTKTTDSWKSQQQQTQALTSTPPMVTSTAASTPGDKSKKCSYRPSISSGSATTDTMLSVWQEKPKDKPLAL